jgi:hypothetical protein
MKTMSMMKAKTMKAMSRVTPMQSKRHGDPGRSEAHGMLRRAIVALSMFDTGTTSCVGHI